MNLQVCIPYRPCPFHCPMCIAADGNRFEDLYKKDKEKYFKCLKKALDKTTGSVVITGDTEPTLDKEWLNDVIDFIKSYKGHKIELQTHNYNLHQGYDFLEKIDVVAYSFTTNRDLSRLENVKLFDKPTNRAVLLATKPVISTLTKQYPVCLYINKHFQQITFKLLQKGNGEKENDYVDLVRVGREKCLDIFDRNDKRVWIDENCQDSTNRYKVFRENGKVYKHW